MIHTDAYGASQYTLCGITIPASARSILTRWTLRCWSSSPCLRKGFDVFHHFAKLGRGMPGQSAANRWKTSLGVARPLSFLVMISSGVMMWTTPPQPLQELGSWDISTIQHYSHYGMWQHHGTHSSFYLPSRIFQGCNRLRNWIDMIDNEEYCNHLLRDCQDFVCFLLRFWILNSAGLLGSLDPHQTVGTSNMTHPSSTFHNLIILLI